MENRSNTNKDAIKGLVDAQREGRTRQSFIGPRNVSSAAEVEINIQSDGYRRRSLPPDDFNANTEYDMTHPSRGVAFVINSMDLKIDPVPVTSGSADNGYVDLDRLYESLNYLEFEVKVFNGFSVEDIYEIVDKVSSIDHSNYDCFMCVVLTRGHIRGHGGAIFLEELAEPFKKSPSLLGKPKIFVIQAPRGDKLDPGISVVTDGPSSEHQFEEEGALLNVPKEADFLWAFATPPGFDTFSKKQGGSWFIEALTEAINKCGLSYNFMHALTYANYICAHRFETNQDGINVVAGKKQSSNFTSTLTKNLFFKSKQEKHYTCNLSREEYYKIQKSANEKQAYSIKDE